ncbi:MAG: hypothetical protein WCY62_00445 [Clostridia bacterium]
MPNQKNKLKLDENIQNSIYEDTTSFISYIYDDYDFYQSLVDKMTKGEGTATLNRKVLQKNIDEIWVKRIEDALPSLDIVIRTTRKDIKEVEEILPIELSRSITVKSLQHLATHTNFIDKVDEEGNITPNKLLNVFKDEDIFTYENKFINTLIYKLNLFIENRYEKLKEYGADEIANEMLFDLNMKVADTDVKLSFKIETKDRPDEEDRDKDLSINIADDMSKTSLWKRVLRLKKIVNKYEGSPFAKNMGKAYVRPPIMRTNAITKNIYLRECLELWLFIESYESAGFAIESSAISEKPNEELIRNLYSLLAFQYVIFRKNTGNDISYVTANRKYVSKFKPKFIRSYQDVQTDEYDFTQGAIRKVYITDINSKRKLTEEEVKIKNAVDNALLNECRLQIREEKIVKAEAARKKAKAEAEKKKARDEAAKRRTKAAAEKKRVHEEKARQRAEAAEAKSRSIEEAVRKKAEFDEAKRKAKEEAVIHKAEIAKQKAESEAKLKVHKLAVRNMRKIEEAVRKVEEAANASMAELEYEGPRIDRAESDAIRKAKIEAIAEAALDKVKGDRE